MYMHSVLSSLNDGVVQLKKTNDGRMTWIVPRNEKDHFLKTNKK